MDEAIEELLAIMNSLANWNGCRFVRRGNIFFIQFFGGQHVDKCLLQFVNPASDKALSALPII
jgi:hypothetical protein